MTGTEAGYEYDDAEPGMQDAVERARAIIAEESAPTESVTQLPEMDLSGDKVTELPEMDLTAPSGDTAPAEAASDAPPPMPPPEPTEPWALIKHGLEQNASRPPPVDPLIEKMKAVGWSPKSAEAPPDWEKLQRNLQAALERANTTRTIQQSLHAVAPQFQADPNAGAADIAAAKVPLDVAEQRQQHEAKQRQAEADLLAKAKQQALTDPSSPQSQRARSALRPVFEMAGKVPDDFESWSAADVEQHAKSLTPIATTRTTAQTAHDRLAAVEAEKDRAAADKKAAADKTAAEEAASLEQERALLLADPRAKKLGLTADMLSKLDRKGIGGIQHQMESMPKEKPAGAPAPHIKAGDYSTIPEADRETVRAIVEGRAKAPDPGSRFGMKILSYVTQMDPTFDATRYGAYKHVVEHQATDKDIVAARTAQEHIKQARNHIPENFDSQMLNRLRQSVLSGVGSDKMTPFEVDVKVAADEYAKALGNNAQSGRQEVEHLLSAVQSPQQLVAALDEVDHLLATKQAQWTEQLKAVAPKSHGNAPNTRPMKNGGVAYQGIKSGKWFTTAEEAQAN